MSAFEEGGDRPDGAFAGSGAPAAPERPARRPVSALLPHRPRRSRFLQRSRNREHGLPCQRVFKDKLLYFKQVRLGSELFLRMFFVTLTHSRVHKYRGPRKDAGGRQLSDSPPPTRHAARSTWHSASRPTSVIAPRCVSWAPELGMTVTDECWLRTTPTGFEIFL